MAVRLENLIGEAQALSPQEQVELISAVLEVLRRSYQQPELGSSFWQPEVIDDLVQTQAVQPVGDIAELAFDGWPGDETADEVIAYIYGQRQADRLRPV